MSPTPNRANSTAWTLDQLAKSAFFRRKLHEWKLLEVAEMLNQVRGEDLVWTDLTISEQAWNKIIHRGIKPVIVFAHPHVLQTVPGSAGYYRMLAMVRANKNTERGIQSVAAQCKRYTATVGVETAREFYGSLQDNGIDKGYLVTTSNFSLECRAYCQRHNIILVNGLEIARDIKRFGLRL